MIRCAIYIRVSTEEQALHGLSLETQKSSLTQYAKEHNYEIVDYYIDEGKTARKKIEGRSNMQRLINDVSLGKIDLIIFTKLDRWFRNISDYYKIQAILEKNKVNWKTINENYDTSTANGRLHINIMLSVAQDEADRTSERIKAVFQNKLRNGEAICRSLPIGYKIENKKVVIDDSNAEVAKEMFDLYVKYQSPLKVYTELKDRYNTTLTSRTIRNALRNKVYNGTYCGIDDFCPKLISDDTFNKVQQMMNSRSIATNKSGRTYIFSGLLKCKECNHTLIANFQKRKDKGYIYYRCMQHSANLCTHKKVIYENAVENFILNNLEPTLIEYQKKYEVKNKKNKTLKVNKSNIKAKLERLKELYINDLIDMDMYKKDYDNLTTLLNTKDDSQEEKDLTWINDFLASGYAELYTSFTPEEKRMLLRSYIKEIVVDKDNKMEIVLMEY